jgi:hypothetical protein
MILGDGADIGPSFIDFAALTAALPTSNPSTSQPLSSIAQPLPSPARLNGVSSGTMTPRRANPEVTTARLISGHVIEEDYTGASPAQRPWEINRSGAGTPTPSSKEEEGSLHRSGTRHSISSVNGVAASTNSTGPGEAWGSASGVRAGSIVERDDASDDENDLQILDGQGGIITLVGDVSNRTAIILDDTLDHPAGYIAAAEHLVKNCGAKEVVVMGTHGIFADEGLQELESCSCIDMVVPHGTCLSDCRLWSRIPSLFLKKSACQVPN